ncbi:MAG: hypothetical protein WCC60_18055 [Ilumatobacteraceae bacterium]
MGSSKVMRRPPRFAASVWDLQGHSDVPPPADTDWAAPPAPPTPAAGADSGDGDSDDRSEVWYG